MTTGTNVVRRPPGRYYHSTAVKFPKTGSTSTASFFRKRCSRFSRWVCRLDPTGQWRTISDKQPLRTWMIPCTYRFRLSKRVLRISRPQRLTTVCTFLCDSIASLLGFWFAHSIRPCGGFLFLSSSKLGRRQIATTLTNRFFADRIVTIVNRLLSRINAHKLQNSAAWRPWVSCDDSES